MKSLATYRIRQKTAQISPFAGGGFVVPRVSGSVVTIAGASSKMSACTSQNRYPSPSERSGPFWAGPFFLPAYFACGHRQVSGQGGLKSAENRNTDLGNSQVNPDMLESAPITTNVGGRRKCRLNTLSLWQSLLRHLPDVWTMTSNVPLPVQPQVPLSPMLQTGMCLPVPSLVRALVRSAMMQGCVTKTSNSFRVTYPFMTTHETTTAGAPLRWFFLACAKFAFLNARVRAGSGTTGAGLARIEFGKAC